jgi:hypothetical protein
MKKTNFFKIMLPLLSGLMFIICCDKAPEYPVEPKIEFVSLSKNTFQPNFSIDTSVVEDFILATIKFQDGDGDLGDDGTPTVALTNVNLPINDTNPQFFEIKEQFPQNGVGKAITGEMTIKIKGLCCTFGCNEPTQPSPELVPHKLYIIDRAGHKSNEILLPSISVPCK